MRRRAIVLLVVLAVLVPAVALGIWLTGPTGRTGRPSPFGPEPTATSPLPSVGRPTEGNPFGVFFNPRQFDATTRVRLAQELGAHYYRSYPVLLSTWDGQCSDDCEAVASGGLAYYLTIRNTAEIQSPAGPVDDLAGYRDNVARVIEVFRPAVIAVENEEDVPGFFTGTADEYVAELQAGCEVAHRMNVRCSNGGLTGGSTTYLAYQHLVDSGDVQGAQAFAERNFEDYQLRQYDSPTWEQFIQDRVAYLNAFILRYREAGADYVNFHWYSDDAEGLAQTVAFLEEATGLPAVSNELGPDTTDFEATRALMQTLVDRGVPVAVWYSSDARIAMALVERDGRLRPSGQAFAEFVRDRFAA